MGKSEKEQKILADINKMIDNRNHNLIFPNTLYDWVLEDYKPDDRWKIINGLVKQGYLKRTTKGNAYIVLK